MKKLSTLVIVAALGSTALLGFSIVPAAATQGGGIIPSVCADPATKTAHPDWYRDGGYCMIPETGYLGMHKY
jgi:hypothetical protein